MRRCRRLHACGTVNTRPFITIPLPATSRQAAPPSFGPGVARPPPPPRDANAEHELEEGTADVDRFVSEEAVVRVKIYGDDGNRGSSGVAGREEGDRPAAGAAAAQEEAAGMDGAGGAVSRLDEDHLRGVLEQVHLLVL